MPTSSSRLSYPDCEAFFDKALDDNVGARLPFNTRGDAYQFRVRCHQFRQICREDNRRIHDRNDALYGRSVYDPITLSILPTEDNSEWFVYARRCTLNESEIESLSELEGPHDARA